MHASDHELRCDIQQQSPIPIQANFSCKKGELLAVVGPSGGGKTTLLRMIAGLSKPQSGEITCGDQTWFDKQMCLSPQARHIGYMPQHFGLFPHLSALDNVMAGLDHLPKPQRRIKALEWLEKVNLQGFPERLPANLSGGQRQRVALARALAREPNILLLDEPFSAVDRETRERLYIELARLKSQLSIPVVMVTHDINEALLLADRMILISQGKMLQQGKPFDVLSHPHNEAVARQMGLRNIFDGEVIAIEAENNLVRLQFGEHVIVSDSLPQCEIGQTVRWVIPNQGVRFNSITRGRLCRSINKIDVTIESLLTMGETVRVIASMQGVRHHLNTEIPSHLAAKLALRVGLRTTVALKSNQVHLLVDNLTD
ncbi:ABC transporter ATP-binding protein [Shewanella maritima]|uniref:ABC transporter ATP-binding protein n=1 Tax=Shewanella maritima TaxID=2520507 RepID=UPI00373532BA